MNFVKHALWMKESGLQIIVFCVESTPIHKGFESSGINPILINKNKKYFDLKNAKILGNHLMKNDIQKLWITDNRDLSLIAWVKKLFFPSLKVIYRQAMRMGVKKKDWIHTQRFKAIDIWISTLDYMAKEVIERTHVLADKIKVVPLAFTAKNNSESSSTPNDFGITENKTVVGLIGRIDPHKGQLFVLSQWKNIVQKFPEAHLLIVGEPTRNEGDEYKKKIEDLIHQESLSDSVTIHPFLKDTSPFYKRSDVVVVASAAETFGMVTIEAMTYGKAILGTNTAGTPELLGFGKFGSLYPPSDGEVFTQKLLELVENPEMRMTLGEKAQKEALSKYSIERFCKSMMGIINDL